MKKPFQIAGITTLTIVFLFVIVLVYLPQNYSMKRSIVIKAKVSDILPQLNNLHNWNNNWSPWVKADSTLKISYSKPECGKGATMQWTGKQMGKGEIAITHSNTDSIAYTLHFTDFDSYSKAVFILTENEEGTKLEWINSGNLSFFLRWMQPLMEKITARDYETGLVNIKSYVESHKSKEVSTEMKIETSQSTVKQALLIKVRCNKKEIGKKLAESYNKILAEMRVQELTIVGWPFAIYYQYENDLYEFEAGLAVNKKGICKTGVQYREFRIQPVVQTLYHGSYDSTGIAHTAIKKWLLQHNKKVSNSAWEFYVNDPETVKNPAEYQTLVVYPMEK